MFAIAGAPLDEVWGSSKPLKPSGRSRSVRPRRASPKPTKVYDDIMEAYLDDFNPACDKTSDAIGKQVSRNVGVLPESDFYEVSPYFHDKQARSYGGIAPCNGQVAPLTSSEFANDALEYQRFFKNDHMFQGRKELVPEESEFAGTSDNELRPDIRVEVEEEQLHRMHGAKAQEEAYQYHDAYDERRVMQPDMGKGQYLDLGLYIFSGIILIILLEQILHLGLYLR